jgi:hypothetical protein
MSCDLVGPGSISGGCDGYDISALPTANTTYAWTITVTGPSGTNSSGPVSATTSLKSLTADATPAFGTCSAPNTPSYCGADSSSQAGTSFPGPGIGTPVAGGTVLLAACWTTGDNINAPATNTNDNRWINIPSQGSKPWMSVLYFNPSGDAAIAGLPHC